MIENREAFLENQIKLYISLIDELVSAKKNNKQRKDLENLQILHKKYIEEYKELLTAKQSV